MKKRVTYRPGKANGILSGVVGIIFVILGVVMIIPNFGLFGLIWTLIALIITINNFYHAFGKKYVGPEIHIENDTTEDQVENDTTEDQVHHAPADTGAGLDTKGRLEQLERLKEAGLLTDEEYKTKRDQIIGQL